MLNGGVLDYNYITQWANHHGLSNNWTPSGNFPSGGFSHTLSSGGNTYKVHGHGTNPNAVTHYPGSNSANGPTASVKNLTSGQNFREDGTWGSFGSNPNGAHIPLVNSPF